MIMKIIIIVNVNVKYKSFYIILDSKISSSKSKYVAVKRENERVVLKAIIWYSETRLFSVSFLNASCRESMQMERKLLYAIRSNCKNKTEIYKRN